MRRFVYFWLYFVAVVASLGGLLSGFDTGVISGALLFINQTWDLSDYLQGFLVSSVLENKCCTPKNLRSSWSAAAMQARKPRLPPRAWAAARCS